MKYTVRNDKEIQVKLAGYTHAAIQATADLIKLEKKVEKKEEELTKWVLNIPDEDLPHFVAITDEMRNR